MFISFQPENKQDTASVSLAYKLGIGPAARWRTMSSGIKLTYEDNPEDSIEVWVAEPTRRSLKDELPTGAITTKYHPVWGYKGVTA